MGILPTGGLPLRHDIGCVKLELQNNTWGNALQLEYKIGVGICAREHVIEMYYFIYFVGLDDGEDGKPKSVL